MYLETTSKLYLIFHLQSSDEVEVVAMMRHNTFWEQITALWTWEIFFIFHPERLPEPLHNLDSCCASLRMLFVLRCNTTVIFAIFPSPPAAWDAYWFLLSTNLLLWHFADGPQVPEEPEVFKEGQQEEWWGWSWGVGINAWLCFLCFSSVLPLGSGVFAKDET